MSTFSAWPEIIQQAFYDTWIYDNGCYLEEVDRFTQQWGSLDSEAFLRALSKGQGKERIFALFALGLQNLPGIVELFFPFLESDRPEERWASAISLGRLRQEQVFQLLQDLLLESTQDYLEVTEINDAYAWYHHHRSSIALLLGAWGNPQATPVLRQTLQAIWQFEQQPGPLDSRWKSLMDDLHFLEDNLAYALGQLEAWGALLNLGLSPWHQRWAMQHMILGHLQVKLTGWPNLLGIYVYDDEVSDRYPPSRGTAVVEKKQVKAVLARCFGLSEKEQAEFFLQLADVITERDEEAVTK